jgi:hypothetical protein
MAYIGKKPSDITRAIATYDTFTGDGSTTTFTLTQSAASANDLTVVVNNVRQEPGSSKSYTLTAPTSLIFNVAPAAADEIYVINPTQIESIVNAGAVSDGIISNAKLAQDIISAETAETSVADDDLVLVHDTSAGALRKMTKANFSPTVITNNISDADSDTKIQVEEGSDEDTIRYDIAGAEVATQTARGLEFTAVGGFVMNQTTNSQTFTIASTENAMVAGPIAFTGTITVEGTLAVV